MPSLGADMEDGTLVEWRVKTGDTVKRGDIIADVDTQKGLIEIEVFDEGIIDQLMIKEGEKVPVGTVMALIEPDKEKMKAKAEIKIKADVISSDKVVKKEPAGELVNHSSNRIKISPLAKKIAQKEGVDISVIKGSGPEGSIVKHDIEEAIESKIEIETEIPQPKEKKKVASKNIRLAIAAAMSKSNREIPHFYLETKIDMTKALNWLEETNKQRDVKNRLLSVVLLIKATAKALKKVPELNAYWESDLQLKKNVNIGFAVSLRSGGLVIPAIHDADHKTVDKLMDTLNDLIPRAKTLNLRSSELSESSATITNIGEGNVDKVYGVIYPPQVALIGFGNISEQPWAENGALSVRSVVNVTLAADHRAIDGHLGSKFLTSIKNNLQIPEEL